MIISDLKNWRQETGWVTPTLRKALEWLETEVSADTPVGRYDIEGDRMYVLIQQMTTEPAEKRLAESHRSYIDIQLLLSGREIILAARDDGNQVIVSDELAAKDKLAYREVGDESRLDLHPGTFAVFFPMDIHRPCCSAGEPAEIRKAVVKIHIDLLK